VRAAASAATSFVAVVLCLLAIAPSAATAEELPSGFQGEPVLTGLEEPTTFRFSSDGRIFVAEKTGKILVFDGIDDETPELFADMRTQVYDTGDRGILGLALDPSFPAKPYVYVLYTYDHILGEGGAAPRWGLPNHTGDDCSELRGADACVVSGRLVRLTADGDHAIEDEGNPLEDVLVEGWCQQFSSHSVGDLQFGPEGALYASGGDGASFSHTDYGQLGEPENPCGDPPFEGGALRAQDVRTPADPTGLNGSVIRIDPETGEGLPDNPLVGNPDANARRIVAFGLRNPFRFAIDPVTHEVYVGNVGWNDFEEIDRFNASSAAAYNSGWPCYEGPDRQSIYENADLALCESLYEDPGSASPPFFSYRHRQGLTPGDPCLDFKGSAIAGFAFYGEGPFPDPYHGALFFTDSVRGCIYVMFPGADGRPDPSTVTTFMTHSDPYSGVDLEVGPEGDVYYASLFTEAGGNEFEPGAIHRIRYFSGNQPPVARLSVDHQWGPKPLQAEFDASGSSDADEDSLEYEWDLDGDGEFEDAPTTDSTVSETFNDASNHTVAVRVVDPGGAESVARVTVYPDDTPPLPTISAPKPSLEWSAGAPVVFKGSAQDAEDGTLAVTSLDWVTRLYHCPQACHAHPLQAFPSVASGSFLAPEHDLPSHIEVTLTAVDSRGLVGRKSVEIDPQTVDLNIVSDPPGLPLSAGLLSGPTPLALHLIRGTSVTLSAPASAQLEGVTQPWRSWSDGGARVHAIVANSSTTYTASYREPESPPPTPTPPTKATEPVHIGLPFVIGPRLRKHPAKKTRSTTARFVFSSKQEGTRFRCSLDRGSSQKCDSPLVYRHLKPGKHSFQLVAIARSGERVTRTYSWTVLKPG
jgi:glucose/arabinose dehydrogenase